MIAYNQNQGELVISYHSFTYLSMAGIYIHVPFCQIKCRYCDFYSITYDALKGGYVRALLVEIEKRSYEVRSESIETIYFGGGTPSLLSPRQIEAILRQIDKYYRLSSSLELTLECNPGDLSSMEILNLVSLGVNRVSIGAQSFSPKVLQFLGRRHSPEETIEMVEIFQGEGIDNISLDLIYGIPGTTLKMLQSDLELVKRLSPTHISAYHLIYEENTPMWRDLQKGIITPIDEDRSLQMGHLIQSFLKENSFHRYEISNYALDGYESKHNTAYWQGTPYIGFGPSAHSYVHPWRSWNEADLKKYCDELLNGAYFLNRTYEYITPEMAYEEFILTRLRTTKGVLLSELSNLFGEKKKDEFISKVTPYLSKGLIMDDQHRYFFSEEGFNLSDGIIAELA